MFYTSVKGLGEVAGCKPAWDLNASGGTSSAWDVGFVCGQCLTPATPSAQPLPA